MDFLKLTPKLRLEKLEILSRYFAEFKFMDALHKFAVYVYCMEKTATLLTDTVLAETSVSSSFIANATEADCVLWEEWNIEQV